MKKLLSLLCLMFVGVSVFAQYTAIPDPNFENALAAYDDIANDGQVPTANIAVVTSLSVPSQNISDITGIEDFTNLEILSCGGNQLTSIDTSQNVNLLELWCYDNQLTSLDVSQNLQLTNLTCATNEITSLDVTQNILLTELVFYYNQITNIDVSNLPELTRFFCGNNLLNSLDVSQNTLLVELIINDNQLSSLDISQNPALINITCSYNPISNIDVSQNPLLENITVRNTQLTSLDVSNNQNLLFLNCQVNEIADLDLSQNLLIEDLFLYGNQLSNIDVSQNSNLEFISFGNNPLQEMDLSNNTALNKVRCVNCQNLTSLDMRNGNNTNIVTDDFDILNNPNLICISVDDVAYADVNWTSIDPQISFNVDCALGVNDAVAEVFSIYPNPTVNEFYIDTNSPIQEVIIIDSLGRVVATFNSQTSYNVSNLTVGMYFVKIKGENSVNVKKLMIK